MRVSTDINDSGYLTNAQDWHVKFNYEFVRDVVMADDVEGVIRYVTADREQDDLVKKEARGAVQLFNPFQVPDNPKFVSLPDSLSANTEEYEIKI